MVVLVESQLSEISPPRGRARWREWLPGAGLYLGAALEAYLFTWGRSVWGPLTSAVVFTAASLLVVVAAFYYRPDRAPAAARPPRLRGYLASLVGVGAALIATGQALVALFAQHAININYSDILPAIQVYCRRLLWGSPVYRELTHEMGYQAYATYLPTTWLPFVVAEWFNFDYRWVALGGWLVGIVVGWMWLVRLRRPWPETLLKALWPLALIYSVAATDPSIFTLTAEALIAGYVVLLAGALLTRSVVFGAVALTLCLLSRYFILIWVPLLALLLLLETGWRRTVAFGLLVLGLLIAGYFWPVWRHDPGLMLRVQSAYQDIAVNEWLHLDAATGRPIHPFNGLGLAPIFFPDGVTDRPTLRAAADQLRRVQLGVIGAALGAVALGWWRHRRRTGPDPARARWVAVVSLKLFLVLFFALLHVPYSYMILVSVALTAFLVTLGPGGRAVRPALVARPGT